MVKEEEDILSSAGSEEPYSDQSTEEEDSGSQDSPISPKAKDEEVEDGAKSAEDELVEEDIPKHAKVEDDAKDGKIEWDILRNPKLEDEKSQEILLLRKSQKLDRQSKGPPDFDALIFMCSKWTKMDCFKFGVFGFPKNKQQTVEQVRQGMRLFLFELETKLLYGVFRAASRGGFKLERGAYQDARKSFPWQVRFVIYKECLPLPESVFKEVIKENYEDEKRFKPELSGQQAQKLTKLFRPAPSGEKIFPAYPQPPPKALPNDADKNSLVGQTNDPKKESCSPRRLTRDKSPQRHKSQGERSPINSALNSPLKQSAQLMGPSSTDDAVEPNVLPPEKEKQSDLLGHNTHVDIASSRFPYEALKLLNDVPPSSPLHGTTALLEQFPSSLGSLPSLNSTYNMEFDKSNLDPVGPQLTQFGYLQGCTSTGAVISSGSTALGAISLNLHKPDPYHINAGAGKPDPYGLGLDTLYKTSTYSSELNLGFKPDPYQLGLNIPSSRCVNGSLVDYQQIGGLGSSDSLKTYMPSCSQRSLLDAQREVLPPSLADARLAGLGRPYAYESQAIAGILSGHLGKRPYEDTYLTDLDAWILSRQASDDNVLNFWRRLPYVEGTRALSSHTYDRPTSLTYYNQNPAEAPPPKASRYNAMARPYDRRFW